MLHIITMEYYYSKCLLVCTCLFIHPKSYFGATLREGLKQSIMVVVFSFWMLLYRVFILYLILTWNLKPETWNLKLQISVAKIMSKKSNFQIFFKIILLIFSWLYLNLDNTNPVRFSTDTSDFSNDCLSFGYAFTFIFYYFV